jgi:hypothetical protein
VAGGDVTTRPRRRARADILFLLCKIYCEDVVMHSWKSFITKGFFSVPCNVFHEIAGFLLFLVNLNQLESFFMPFIFSSACHGSFGAKASLPPKGRTSEKNCSLQGCQIFLGETYQKVKKYTKIPYKIPNSN